MKLKNLRVLVLSGVTMAMGHGRQDSQEEEEQEEGLEEGQEEGQEEEQEVGQEEDGMLFLTKANSETTMLN